MDGLTVINKLAGGHLIEDLSRALTEVAQLVVATEKPGKVTVPFTIGPVADMAAVSVSESIKTAPPGPKTRGALFFAVDGELYSNDPRQIPLDFRMVDTDTGEIRSLPDAQSAAREAR